MILLRHSEPGRSGPATLSRAPPRARLRPRAGGGAAGEAWESGRRRELGTGVRKPGPGAHSLDRRRGWRPTPWRRIGRCRAASDCAVTLPRCHSAAGSSCESARLRVAVASSVGGGQTRISAGIWKRRKLRPGRLSASHTPHSAKPSGRQPASGASTASRASTSDPAYLSRPLSSNDLAPPPFPCLPTRASPKLCGKE